MAGTRKIAINAEYGVFGLSPKALLLLYERGCVELACQVNEFFRTRNQTPEELARARCSQEDALQKWRDYLNDVKGALSVHQISGLTVFTADEKYILRGEHHIKRDDSRLISVIEELGPKANGLFGELRIIEIPDDVDWRICEYDGREWVAEKHRT